MGQYFYLINIDEAFYAVKSYVGAQLGGGKLGEWYFSSDVGETLVRLLTVPKIKLPDDPLEGQIFTSVNGSGIHSLPQEIEEQIFDELEDFSDVFCLSLTSRYMWTVGMRTLRLLYVPFALGECGAWAGHRLMIIGDYADNDPDYVFTGMEYQVIDHYRPPDDTLWYRRTLYQPLGRMAREIIVDEGGYDARYKLHSRLAERQRFGTPPWMIKFLDWKKENHSLEYPTDLVLRNLTKKEYVRDDALALPPGYRVQSRHYPLTLGHALMSRIVWSADRSVSMSMSPEFGEELVHGVWTGCEFDIVGFGEWKERDGWEDVSVKVKDDIIYMAVEDGALRYTPESDSQE